MPIPSETGKHSRSLLRDQAYASIRDAIVYGELQPGETLRDPELERWLGISRTPIREALSRLEAAGLVHTVPGKRTVVSTITGKTIQDAQQLVAALQALAMRLAVPVMGHDHWTAMRQANERFAQALSAGDASAALRSDDEFHRVAVEASGNQAIAATLDQYTPVLRRLEYQRFSSLAARGSVRQHKTIVSLCRKGDADGAARAVTLNWDTLSLLADHADLQEPDAS